MAAHYLLAPGPFFFTGGTDSLIYYSTKKDNQVFQVPADTEKLFLSGKKQLCFEWKDQEFLTSYSPKSSQTNIIII